MCECCPVTWLISFCFRIIPACHDFGQPQSMSSMKSMCHFFFPSFPVFLDRDVSRCCCCCCYYFFVFLISVQSDTYWAEAYLLFHIDVPTLTELPLVSFVFVAFSPFFICSKRHLLDAILLTIRYRRSDVDWATGGIRVAAHVAVIGVPADVSFSSAPGGKPRGRGFSRGFSRGRGRWWAIWYIR